MVFQFCDALFYYTEIPTDNPFQQFCFQTRNSSWCDLVELLLHRAICVVICYNTVTVLFFL